MNNQEIMKKPMKLWSSFDDDRAIEKGARCISWVPYPSYQDVKVGDVVRMKNREVDHAFDSCVITSLESGSHGESIVWLARAHMRVSGLGKQPWVSSEVYNVPLADLVGRFEVHLCGRTEYSTVDNRCSNIKPRSIYHYPKGIAPEDASVRKLSELNPLSRINNALMILGQLIEVSENPLSNADNELVADSQDAFEEIKAIVRAMQEGVER